MSPPGALFRAPLAAACAVLLTLASSCKTTAAVWDVAKDAAVPAAVAVIGTATGIGPIATGLAVLAADVTTQAIDGAEIQNDLEDAAVEEVKERVRTEYLPPTAALAWKMWKWVIILAFLASWWFPTPRAWWIWFIKRRAAKLKSNLPPPDP